MASARVSLVFSFSNGFVTNYLKKWEENEANTAKKFFFARCILSNIENKIPKPLADAKISHEELLVISNELGKVCTVN